MAEGMPAQRPHCEIVRVLDFVGWVDGLSWSVCRIWAVVWRDRCSSSCRRIGFIKEIMEYAAVRASSGEK